MATTDEPRLTLKQYTGSPDFSFGDNGDDHDIGHI